MTEYTGPQQTVTKTFTVEQLTVLEILVNKYWYDYAGDDYTFADWLVTDDMRLVRHITSREQVGAILEQLMVDLAAGISWDE